MTHPAIAIVNSSSFGRLFPEHLERLRHIGPVRRFEVSPLIAAGPLARLLKGFQAIVASVQPVYAAGFFRSNRDVVLVARHGIGFNNVDIGEASRRGVLVTKVPGVVEREAMAEHTLALMLAVLRRLLPARRAVARGRWADRVRFVGSELCGRAVGLVGFGNIGSRVGEMLARGFGARVLAYDPNVSAARMAARGAKRVPLRALLKRADVISLHASLNPSSCGMIGAHELKQMRPGAILVNTARGELIDEPALVRHLKSGRIAGLGTDTVAAEPARAGHPFLKCANAIVVPHIGAYTVESLRAMGEKVVADVVDVLVKRRRPGELVNPEVWRARTRRI